jgi:DNA-binding transcriptional MerR regulator
VSDEEKSDQVSLLDIPDKMFYKIRDVAKIAGVKPHVLRYWESEFPTLKPQKNRNGQRIYTRKDIDVVLEIRQLLHGEKYSIAGARQLLKKKKGGGVEGDVEIVEKTEETVVDREALVALRAGLVDLLATLDVNE